MTRVFSHILADSSVVIITLGTPRNTATQTVAEQEQRFLDKTLFEIHRSELANPLFTGEALEDWRRNVHFDDFVNPPVRIAREITGEPLPDRARRHAWRERTIAGRPEIFDNPAIPDLPIS